MQRFPKFRQDFVFLPDRPDFVRTSTTRREELFSFSIILIRGTSDILPWPPLRAYQKLALLTLMRNDKSRIKKKMKEKKKKRESGAICEKSDERQASCQTTNESSAKLVNCDKRHLLGVFTVTGFCLPPLLYLLSISHFGHWFSIMSSPLLLNVFS